MAKKLSCVNFFEQNLEILEFLFLVKILLTTDQKVTGLNRTATNLHLLGS